MTASKHNDSSIVRRSKAVHVMHSVCENVDNVSNVKDKGITKTSQLLRVKKLLQYLRTLKPFDLQAVSSTTEGEKIAAIFENLETI